MLKLYNTLSKSKEIFKPINPQAVNLYVCGMTVYDYCHIGHARTMIVFDMIVRYLRYLGYNVKFVRNITDIDDKIINRANENKEEPQLLTNRFIQAMHEDEQALGLISPDNEPRATEFIPQIIQLIQTLIDKGFAYVGKSGDVYYDISQFKKYGQLSHRNLDELLSGARIEIETAKHNPLDFVLWKNAKPNEPSWDSPWGKGRPGWHIECSAMSTDCLAKHIDIHGGGVDLVFPHHENEIAQSEAATGEKFANYWMHVGQLQVDGKKMSKSLGNFFTIRETLEKHNPETIRYFMLSGHYHSPLDYSEEALHQSHQSLERLYGALRGYESIRFNKETEFEKQFIDAMNDDFNTPKAFSVLFDLSHKINRLKNKDKAASRKLASLLKHLGGIIGLLQQDPEKFLQGSLSIEEVTQIDKLISVRHEARKNRDWAKADEARDALIKMNIELEDTPEGTRWRQKHPA